jgi:hypothetical protein
MENNFIDYLSKHENAEVLLLLMEISHSTIETFRLVKNNENIVHNGNTYEAIGFDIKPPEQFEEEPVSVVTVDMTGLNFIDFFRNIQINQEEVLINLKYVLSGELDVVQTSFELIAKSVSVTNQNITFQCVTERFLNLEYGKVKINPDNFPGSF